MYLIYFKLKVGVFMMNILNNKEKTYEFSIDGLNHAIADTKQEKINNIINIGFWGLMVGLYLFGNINSNKLISMLACTGTNKVVKFIIR